MMNRVRIIFHQPLRIIHQYAALLSAIIIYSILCVALAFGIDGRFTSINSDFGFYNNAQTAVQVGFIIAVAAQMGDLLISKYKHQLRL